MADEVRLPGWPRALGATLAAAYVGLSPTSWRGEVKEGRAPSPIQLTVGRVAWLRDDLDAWLDRRAGRLPATAKGNTWDDV